MPVAHSEEGAGIVVVAHISSGDSVELSKQQVRNLFMGASIGMNLNVVVLPPDNFSRVEFNTKIVGMTESRIQSYWAQMRFSGRRSPPKELSDEQAIIEYLSSNPDSVSYLPANTKLPVSLKVVYQTQ